jgi:cobalamin biosynthesis protein CobT
LDVAEELKDAIGRELGKLADSSMARRRPALPDQYRTLDFTGLCHSPDWTKAFADQSKKAGGPMRQRLSQLLMVEERCWWQGGKARGSPDPRTLAQLATRMGNRVLRSRVEHLKPDTACYLLVDGSASMGHEQRLTQAMLAAAAFSLTLDACGHANCVSIFENENMTGNFYSDMSRARMAGFNDEKAANLAGFTMECVTLRRVKKWSEPASRALEKMAAACGSSAGGTPLGQSILIASKDLLARPEKRKVLMCFTDGGPDDPVLASDACVEAERAGIQLVLIGILNDSVKHLHDRYAVVNDAAKLSGATFEELTKALHPGLGGRRRDRGRKVEA